MEVIDESGTPKTAYAIPFLRWAGSKRQRAHLVRNLWTAGAYDRYVEPFMGSASVFFALRPAAAALSDLNVDLIETFKAVQRNPEGVRRGLTRLPLGREAYYQVRSLDVPARFPAARAARFVYLNRFCFNGLYRTNMAGKFNVPYGRPKTANLPSRSQLKACAAVLQNAILQAVDFRQALSQVQRGDFVYLDPPYAVQTRRVFVEYGAALFSTADLEDLADEIRRLDGEGVAFLLSYADCAEAKHVFSGWPRRRLRVLRQVAGFTGARRMQNELYVSNCPTFLEGAVLKTTPEIEVAEP